MLFRFLALNDTLLAMSLVGGILFYCEKFIYLMFRKIVLELEVTDFISNKYKSIKVSVLHTCVIFTDFFLSVYINIRQFNAKRKL